MMQKNHTQKDKLRNCITKMTIPEPFYAAGPKWNACIIAFSTDFVNIAM